MIRLKEKKRRYISRISGVYLALLVGFTVYVLLDAFVIERSYIQLPSTTRTGEEREGQDEALDTPVVTDTSYEDASVSVELTTLRAYNSTVYVAEITLTDISRLRTAFARDTYGRNITQTVAEMAREKGAIVAINGDYYGAQRKGYVIRDGVLYREERMDAQQEDVCIWPDGEMTIIREGDVTAQELLAEGVLHVLSFGPGLLEDGNIIVSEDEEVGKAMASNPRTAIALIEPGRYLFVVADGRTQQSEGLSLYELAQVLKDYGAVTAYNLDGGGSSTMVFMDEVINYPTTHGGTFSQRAVSDIVYIE